MNKLETVTSTVKEEYTKNANPTLNQLIGIITMGVANKTIEEVPFTNNGVEKAIKKALVELGKVYSEEKAKKEILAMIKARKIPLEFLKIEEFILDYAEKCYSSSGVIKKLVKNLLGEKYPLSIANGYKSNGETDTLRIQCPRYMLHVLENGGSPEDLRKLIAAEGYTETNPKGQWGKVARRVKANLDLEMNNLRTAQKMLEVLGIEKFKNAFK